MSSNSPCAACKFLRRKCTPGCVFAPYFPPDQPTKFVYVHRVFGASNVAKLLSELTPAQREDAANSLAYEAEARLRDPVYGCVGYISLLQHKLKQVQHDLYNAKKDLATYIGPAAFGPFLLPPHHPHQYQQQQQQQQHHHLQGPSPSSTATYGAPGMGMGMGLGLSPTQPSTSHHPQILMREPQQQSPQQIAEAQQMAMAVAAAREQEMMRNYDQQQELARFNTGFPDGGRDYNQIGDGTMAAMPVAPSSGLGLVPAQPFDGSFAVNQMQPPPPQQQHQRARSDDGRSGIGPST
ncbi:hypothetical protein BHE74_00042567 [Ensete ventricosum]|nr:hypothetical protein BHE74_00042567 [Ensete ventricosum]